ncbi:MAG: polyprenyl synthetase family protein [Candidatus Altiarchaeota archaeon]|nr:polyprenyl synthetase family protein [Candidatus Altiarchaeota archaeon]
MIDFLDQYKTQVDNEIKVAFSSKQKELMSRCQDYVERGGKRIRPLLVFLGALEGEGKPEDVLKVAASIEIMHNFTLVHDDIEDKSDFRRGSPALHKTHGIPLAINTGDAMFAKSFELISSVSQKLANEFAKTMWEIASGQDLDISWSESSKIPSESDYILMVSKKTGELIGFSLESGYTAVSGESNPKLKKLGINLGIAFQIIDDVLGVIGDKKTTGKDTDKDIIEGKRSLPIIKAIELSPNGDKIKKIILKKEKTSEDIALVRREVKASGAVDYCFELAKQIIKNQNYDFKNKQVEVAVNQLKEFFVNRKY